MAERPTFAHLKDAVEKMDGFLKPPINLAGLKSLAPTANSRELAQLQAYYPLSDKYAGQEFPSDADTFKLGGHRKELGHLHVDWQRQSNGEWSIENVWMCR